MNDWAKIEELTRNMALILLQAGTPQEVFECSAASERAADDWLRNWILGPAEFVLPENADVRRSLLARFRFATVHAQRLALRSTPLPSPSANAVLQIYLIDLWHAQFRRQWLLEGASFRPTDN